MCFAAQQPFGIGSPGSIAQISQSGFSASVERSMPMKAISPTPRTTTPASVQTLPAVHGPRKNCLSRSIIEINRSIAETSLSIDQRALNAKENGRCHRVASRRVRDFRRWGGGRRAMCKIVGLASGWVPRSFRSDCEAAFRAALATYHECARSMF